MADIQKLLQQLLTAIYGKDVRQTIVDCIKQCYNDASTGLVPVVKTKRVTNGIQITITVGVKTESFVIEDAYNPVRGIDYWTDEDIAVINDEIYTMVLEETAKRGQLRPEFANNISECTDTSKLYVLPDNFIYAHMYIKDYTDGYTNLFDESKSGFVNEGTKFYTNWMLYNQTDNDNTGTIYHFKGLSSGQPYKMHFAMDENGTGESTLFYCTNANQKPLQTSDYDDSIVIVQHGPTAYNYVRFEIREALPSNLIITANEKIEGNEASMFEGYTWKNTGHAFVPADYDSLIAELVQSDKDHEERLLQLEENPKESEKQLPDYWIDEIDSLEEIIRIRQGAGNNAVQFVWCSDIHGTGTVKTSDTVGTSNKDYIGMIARQLMDKYNIPFFIITGDIMSQSSHSTEDNIYSEYKDIWEMLSCIDVDELLAMKGNHDGAWGEAVDGIYYMKNIGNKKTYNNIYRKQTKDRTRVFGDDGTYYYVDYENVRFIMLNSHTDGDGSNDSDGLAAYNSMKVSVYGQEQLDWLVNVALNNSNGKDIILFGHPQIGQSADGILLAGILDAYNNREVYNDSLTITDDYWGATVIDPKYKVISVNADFSGAEGKVVAYFHGHNHKDLIYKNYTFPCIAITTAGADVRDSEPVVRVVGTATETALDIVTIDLLNKIIYTTRVGAGEDREISY